MIQNNIHVHEHIPKTKRKSSHLVQWKFVHVFFMNNS